MDSNKSRPRAARKAVEPRRRPGKERVESLLAAAEAVIAERGYEGATMSEIASRAGALAGSLYHFFPSKEAVGEALIRRFAATVDGAFDALDARVASMSAAELADALLDFMLEIRGASRAIVPLMEARADWSSLPRDFTETTLRRIARALALRSPGLAPEEVRAMAVVLLQNMKAVKHLADDDPAAAAEMRLMTRTYLAFRLSDPSQGPSAE